MPGLRLHPRTRLVAGAGADLRSVLAEFQVERDLTDTEMAMVLLGCAETACMHALRAERHPGDPDRKADEACEATYEDGDCACTPGEENIDEDEGTDDDDNEGDDRGGGS